MDGSVADFDFGVCLTILTGVLPTETITDLGELTGKVKFANVEREGVTCPQVCAQYMDEMPGGFDPENDVLLCCDDKPKDGSPCNKLPAGDKTFGRMMQTQTCGKRCQDRKPNFITELCTKCEVDYDCSFNLKCVEKMCVPPASGNSG